jgi:hypothetical protein
MLMANIGPVFWMYWHKCDVSNPIKRIPPLPTLYLDSQNNSIWYPRCYLICLPHLLTLGLLKTQHDSWINNLFINQYVCVFLNSLKLIPILMKFVVKGVLSISVEISTLWQNTCLSIYTITLSHKSYNILSYSMLF